MNIHFSRKGLATLFAFGTSAVLLLGTARAQTLNINAGQTISQNFDGIGTSATATLPDGFRVSNTGSPRTVGTFASAGNTTSRAGAAGLSSSAANGIYNFGAGTDATGTSDRAIGFLSSGSATQTGNLYLGLTAGTDLSSFNISYNVEKYRNGSNTAGFATQLYYSTDGTTFVSAGSAFTTTFAADANNNGFTTAPGTTVPVSGTFTIPGGLAAGSNLYFAFNYSVASGTTTTNAQALGFDDLSFAAVAVPEPATVFAGVLLIGALGWNQRRRLGGLAGRVGLARAA